ncbi:MAG TPA: alpha-amylase, partial [Elusimicrobia bacterium]|nr:alpha-amylase [Elusimicrobiota bacterium]
LEAGGEWESLFSEKAGRRVKDALLSYLRGRRWFEGRAHQPRALRILDAVPFDYGSGKSARLLLLRVEYLDAAPESYLLPVSCACAEEAERIRQANPFSVIANLQARTGKGAGCFALFDAAADPSFCSALLAALRRGARLKGRSGEVLMSPSPGLAAAPESGLQPSPAKVEQKNTTITFGDSLVLKLFRRIESGSSPDVEIGRFLSKKGFRQSPSLEGEIAYRCRSDEPWTLAVLHGYVPNRGDAWQFTLDSLRRYFEETLAAPPVPQERLGLVNDPLALIDRDPDPLAVERIGSYLETARLLGRRTAELHLALASETGDPAFAPEPFTELSQRAIHQSMRNRALDAMDLLRQRLATLPQPHRPEAQALLGRESEILQRLKALTGAKLSGSRIRCHNDYHLKQLLYTGADFQIFDFEGPADRALQVRRVKRSPLRDAACMLRSFHFAAYTVLLGRVGVSRAEDVPLLEPPARFWYQWVSSSFLRSYLKSAEAGSFLPKTRKEMDLMLRVLLLERALEELRSEVVSHPDWAILPLKGAAQLLEDR